MGDPSFVEEDDHRSTDGDLALAGSLGRVRLSPAQCCLLAVLVALVTVISVIGYLSNRQIDARSEALIHQIQRVSADRASLEREVHTYALVVDRWQRGLALAGPVIPPEELSLHRALVQRQIGVTAARAAADLDVAGPMAELLGTIDAVDAVVGADPAGIDPGHLDDALDAMSLAAKRINDLTETQDSVLVHELEDGVRTSRRAEWTVAGLILALVGVLLVSLRRMLTSNLVVAAAVLRREHHRLDEARVQRSAVERRYREVVDEVSDVVFRCDRHGRWTLLNAAFTRLTGHPVEATLGRPLEEAVHPDDRDRVAGFVAVLASGRLDQVAEQLRLRCADGSEATVVLSARAATDEGSAETYLAGTIRDVSARVRSERLAAAQAEILEMVALDLAVGDVLQRIVARFGPLAGAAQLRFALGSAASSPDATGSVPLPGTAGEEPAGWLEWFRDPEAPGDDHLDAVVVAAARLGALAIDRQRAADRLTREATYDTLTGLANRALLADRVAEALECARRAGTPLSLLFLDLDRFKVVNDSLGHTAGDRLLVQIADRLTSTLRRGDTAARFGGDEFVILTQGSDETNVRRLAERIHAVVARPVDLEGTVVRVNASIGIVTCDGSSTVDDLMRRADVAMYRAKQEGGSRTEVFDDVMHAWVVDRHDTETALRGALHRGELEVWYQPVVRLGPEALAGFEALLRWRRPDVGIVGPNEFIPLAEEIGIIDDLGAWVLTEATRQLAEWRRIAPGLTISVNVSGRQLASSGYVESVAATLERAGVDPGGVTLEITESVLLDDATGAATRLAALRSLGLRVALDDFGTGYSSLRYLRQLPVDILKIDRFFVSATGPGLHDATIVGSVTELGHALGLDVVAEGIETPDQRDELVAIGADCGQGYLYGPPVPVAEAHALVAVAAPWHPHRAGGVVAPPPSDRAPDGRSEVALLVE